MSPRRQAPPSMNPGIVSTSFSQELQTRAMTKTDPTRQEMMDKFLTDLAEAMAEGPTEDSIPHTEAPRAVIEHFNRRSMEAFDQVGYFLFQGVKVYEEGKKEWAREQEDKNLDYVTHKPAQTAKKK